MTLTNLLLGWGGVVEKLICRKVLQRGGNAIFAYVIIYGLDPGRNVELSD
jgi:hypothetical protein